MPVTTPPSPRADWALYDQPELLEAVSTALPDGRREALLAVDGVHCAGCVRGVERSLDGQVRDLRVNLATRTLEFRFDPRQTPLSALLQRLDGGGYRPQPLSAGAAGEDPRKARRAELARLGVAVICAMQVMMLAWPDYFDGGEIDRGVAGLMRWSQWLLATPAVLFSGWPFLARAWSDLRHRRLGMDVPVAASILIAYFASAARTLAGHGALYFDAATMFVMLLGIGRYLEGRSRTVAGARLRLLAGRQALTALRVADDGQAAAVPIVALRPGDRLRVPPGETVPADGGLLDAQAELDESLLSGESRPVRHVRGEALLAGSLNVGFEALELRAQATGAATRLAAITRLLRRAEADKPPAQLWADRIAGHFVLAVLLLALAALAWWWPRDPARALDAVLAVLVVSCPCALSLAIPTVYAAAASRLAAAGVLLAQPSALARTVRLGRVLFDKTGTLTEPRLSLVELRPLRPGVPAEHCRQLAAALERGLPHPIARALSEGGSPWQAEAVRLAADGGLSGRIDGHDWWIGPPERRHLSVEGDGGLSWVALADRDGPVALFGLAGPVGPEAAATVAALHNQGLRLAIASGDAEPAVARLAAQLGIGDWQSRQRPEDKLATLRRWQTQREAVMAVGDGINDAPLLAAADVGVAMPDGAALAQARADVILTGRSLAGLVLLRRVAAAAERRVRENLGWALGYNLVMLPLAVSGGLTPWLAALGMSLSSLLVVVNALRLLRVPDGAR